MKEGTIEYKLHHWRGFHCMSGPLVSVCTLGWLTVSFFPFLMSKWMNSRTNAVRNALSPKDVPPRAEMAAWGDESKPLHVVIPKGRT